METEKHLIRGKLTGRQHNRLKSLFDMLYKPSELAEEIGINKNQIYRVYLELGCPHERDQKNNIWINGRDFKSWYENTYKKLRLKENEGFCLTCKQAVIMLDNKKREKNGLVYLVGECENCGRKISKILDQKRV